MLKKTNLWLADFAKMQSNDGVRAAIQSLAGVYIYDYQPTKGIRDRVNEHFGVAESRLSQLLNNPQALAADQGNEIITMCAIMSMQDVSASQPASQPASQRSCCCCCCRRPTTFVQHDANYPPVVQVILTERRRKKPYTARWLQGFKQGERFLQMFDPGSRFWKENNVQLTSLRISLSIIIGRAVILSQPMTQLPAPASMDPQREARRFDWLLYGTREEMYEIHGGCGFSKKLLHIISQITYCAARLQQEKDSPIVPVTAGYLYQELADMRQWSSESNEGEAAPAVPDHLTIAWVRDVPEGYIITSPETMTYVTAEAWRIAAIIYLRCRLMR